MTKEIPLTQGRVALVDDDDFERLSKFKWFYRKYAVRSVRHRPVFMHVSKQYEDKDE